MILAISFSAVSAHPGHGEYTPEEVVSPSESSSSGSSYSAPSYSESSSASSAQSSSSSSSVSSSSSGGSSSGGSSYPQSSSSGSYQVSGDSGSANSQSINDGNGIEEISKNDTVKKNNNTTVNSTGDADLSDGDNFFTLNNIAYLIIAFLIGFGIVVLLHKFRVI